MNQKPIMQCDSETETDLWCDYLPSVGKRKFNNVLYLILSKEEKLFPIYFIVCEHTSWCDFDFYK